MLGYGASAVNKAVDNALRSWSPCCIGDLRGRNALVTGANSGIGYETAKKLAENGAKVFMVSRSQEKGEAAAAQIRAHCGGFGAGVSLEVLQCDFIELRNVTNLIQAFKKSTNEPLHLLVAMAGVFYPGPLTMTKDGIELTLQVNFYAHALLTLGLLDRLRMTPGSRVVMMSSGFELLMGKLDWNNLRGEHYKGSDGVAYGTSKVMKMMFAKELSARVPEIDFFCVHPGLVMSPLHLKSRGLPEYPLNAIIKVFAPFLGQSPKRGSESTLYAATEPSLTGKHFAYFCPSLIFMNMFMTSEHTPGNAATRNPAACWRLFEKACHILEKSVGHKAVHVPLHPNDIFAE